MREVLVFAVAGERYAVDILRVREIRGYEKVTPLPATPDYVKGVINLRGAIVPVVDMRITLNQPARYDATTGLVIIALGEQLVGLVVDAVCDVLELGQDDVKPPPELGSHVHASYLSGLANRDDGLILLLDIDRYLATQAMPAAA